MKGRTWRKILAVILSLLIMSGSIPVQPLSGLFGSAEIVYAAGEEELVGNREMDPLQLGENQVTSYEVGEWTEYFFTPSENGLYGFYSEAIDGGDPETALYDDEGNELAYNDDFNGTDSGFYVTLEAGNTYTFKILDINGEETTYNVRIRFIPRQTLADGENNVAVWFNALIEHVFTPTENGLYRFYSTGDEDPEADLYDEYGNQIASGDDNGVDYNFSFTAELEAGREYFFRISGCNDSGHDAETIKVNIEKTVLYSVTVDDSLEHGSVSVSADNAFAGDFITVYAYPDSDYYLSGWAVTNEADNTIIPVYDNDGDGYEDFEMPEGNVTVSAVFTERPSSLVIGENTLPTLNGERVYYSFTPAETGLYIFDFGTNNCDWTLSGSLFEYYYYYGNDYCGEEILVGGTEYTVEVESYDYDERKTFPIEIRYESLPAVQTGENEAQTLYKEDTCCVFYLFTPEESARYRFYSMNSDEGIDPAIELYDGDNLIANDDNSGDNGNFNVIVDLEEGKSYLLRLDDWALSVGAFPFFIENTAHTITVDDSLEHGTIEASASQAEEGEYITLTAEPDDGYIVSKWIVKDAGGNDIEVTNNEFYMPNASVTVSAAFAEPVLQVGENPIVSLDDNAMLLRFTPAATANYSFSTGDISLNTVGLYEGNDELAFEEGYISFSVILEAGKEYELEIWAYGPTNYTLEIKVSSYLITIDDDIEHGTISANVDLADEYETVTLTANPDEGYRLAQWIVTDETENTIEVINDEFTMPAGNVTVSAIFAEPVLSIGENPVMTRSDGEWTEYSFTPSDSRRYRFYSVSDDGNPEGLVSLNDNQVAYDSYSGDGDNFAFEVILTGGVEYTFEIRECNGRAMHFTVCVEVVELPLLIPGVNPVQTIASDWKEYGFCPTESRKYCFYSVGGRYDPVAELYGEEGYINSGDNDTDSDFRFTASLTAGKFYVLKVKDARNRKVSFTVGIEIADHYVTIDDSLEHGTIEASAELAEDGETVTLTANPDNSYYLYRWIVTDENGEAVEVTGNEFIMPKYDVTVSAEFIKKPATIVVGENALPSREDRELKYSFVPDDSGPYRFYSVGDDYGDPMASIYEGDTCIASDDDSGENYHFDFTADLTAGQAYVFRIQSRENRCYTVMVEAPVHQIIIDEEITNGQVVPSVSEAVKGEVITLDVTPEDGYTVKSVSVNDVVIEPGESGYTFTMPGEDAYIKAVFEDTRNIFNTVNITLGGELGLNFYITVPDAVVNSGAKIIMDGPEGEKDVVLSELAKDAKGRYKVTYKIKAVYMDRSVTLKLVDSEGTVLPLVKNSGEAVENNTVEYSIYDYVEKARTVPTITEEEMSIINAMYTYGAYSVKWKFGTEVPEDVDELPDIAESDFTEYKLKKDGASDTITLTGGSLVLDSNTKFRLYFKSSDDIGNHTIMLGDTELTPKKTTTKGKYYVDIENIGAAKLKSDYTVVFDNTYSATVSAMTYIYNFLRSGMDDVNLAYLLRALYAYSEAVDSVL